MKNSMKIGIAIFIIVAALVAFFAVYKPAITGYASAGTTLYVTGGIYGRACNLSLVSGWNLISMVCQSQNTTVQYMLQSIWDSFESVHEYDKNDSNNPWKSYKPGLPSWVEQDLTNITHLKGYWINMNQTGNIYLEGQVVLPGVRQLEPGWNLVGYPISIAKTASEAFANIKSNITSAHAYNATDYSDYWKVYVSTVNDSFNDLKITEPDWAYWINVTYPSIWELNEW